MSRSGTFCPRCGEPVEGAPERPPGEPRDPDDSLCLSCYLDSFDLIDAPDRVRVRVCAQCGAVYRGNRWVDVDAENYSDVAIEAVSDGLGIHVEAEDVGWEVATEQADPTTILAHVRFTGAVRDVPVTEELTIPVDIAKETCTRCGKIAGGSFASIVQLRAVERTPTDEEVRRASEIAANVVAEMAATGDREAFVTEEKETADGLDLKVSTNKIGLKIAKRIVAELGGSYSDSPTLVTEDADGNEVYRVTYAIRLPPYHPDEIVDPGDEGGPVLVRNADGVVTGTRLATGEPYEVDVETVVDADGERIGTRDDARETALVAVVDENAVQVLDPDTAETKTVPRPDSLDADAESVSVLKHRGGLHVLPTEDEVPEDEDVAE